MIRRATPSTRSSVGAPGGAPTLGPTRAANPRRSLSAEYETAIGSRSRSSRTPAFFAAVYASSGIGSHAPKTMSSSFASGTKSLIRGDRFSVRLPSRMVAICVNDPIGFDFPRRMLSTPAMNVVATAPNPGVRIPSVPVAGAMLPVFVSFVNPAKS